MNLDLYVITDEGLSQGLPHPEIARRAIAGGADVIQIRDKSKSSREFFAAAVEVRKITRAHGTLFIVNDRLDIALASGADGVHLGQDDLPLRAARTLVPPGFIIGISVGSVHEAVSAENGGADYIAPGPIFSTASKRDAGPATGLAVLRQIRSAVSVPLVAIGGIGPRNVQEVIQAGADGIAVISAVVSQEDVTAAARQMKSAIVAGKAERNSGIILR
jgi:thiamine-phosphate pyrophosphorylase